MANGSQCELPSNTAAPGQGNGSCEDNGDIYGDGGSPEELGMVNGASEQEHLDGSSSASNGRESNVKGDFEFLWRLRKYLVLLGILAVGVTYNAGITPPGGFWGDNKDEPDGHEAGDPVLRAYFFLRYQIFFYCNSTAFAASLVLIILLLSKRVARQKLWIRSIQFTMILDLFSVMGAYAAGSCRAVKSSIFIWVLVLAVFLYVLIHILVSTRVIRKKLREKVKSRIHWFLSEKLGVPLDQRDRRQENDVEEVRKFSLMLATFAASVTYQAGLSPPGGFWNETGQNKYPAMSILRSKHLARYNFFVSCNTTSFVSSLVTIILLLSTDLSRHGIRCKAVLVCVLFDLLGLIGAYAAGSTRSMTVSFCVAVIPFIVWICFAVVTGLFVHRPVARWLKKNKPCVLDWMHKFGRVLSLDNDRPVSGRMNSASSDKKSLAFEEDKSCGEHQLGDKLRMSNAEDSVSGSNHTRVICQQSENTNPSTDFQSMPKEAMSKKGNPQYGNTQKESSSVDEVKIANGGLDMSIPEHQSRDTQHVANMNGRPSPADDVCPVVVPVEDSSGETAIPCDCNGVTNDLTIERECSDAPTGTTEIEDITTVDSTGPVEIGNMDKNEGAPNQCAGDENANSSPIYEHLNKSRTYLLLLAILAVSLAYQSGLNPPGGFWTKNENNDMNGVPIPKDTHHRSYHMPGDPILEDTHHPRYIAFFYLNAIAFVASLVMIILLLNQRVSRKVLKRYALQIAMIVDLLALTGSYVMGSCRRTMNSISISVLVGVVLAYVVVHILIAIHVIPEGWKQFVAKKLDNLWPNLPPSGQGHNQRDNANDSGRGLGHNQRGDSSEKEWERRRNLLLMLAILAATVTYQAGMNPPGSVWSDDKDASGKQGDPILEDNNFTRYYVFYYSNSFSFVSAVVITILLVNKESCERGIKSYALRVCLVVGLVGLLIAYAAGSCRKAKQSIYLIIIAVAVLASLVIQVKVLSSTHGTHGTLEGCICRFVDYLLELLVGKEEEVEEGRRTTTAEKHKASDHNGKMDRKKVVGKEEEGRRTTVAEKHKDSDHNGKMDRKKHKYLMLLAILAASITYLAGLNPPGGTWPDDGHVAGNPVLYVAGNPVLPVAGNPVLLDVNPRRYNIFFWFNSISLMTSIVVIMFLLNKSIWRKDVPLGVLRMFMVVNLLAIMTAFAAGSCRKFRTSVYVYALVVGVVIYIVIAIFVSVIFAKCLKAGRRIEVSSPPHRGGAFSIEQLTPEQQV